MANQFFVLHSLFGTKMKLASHTRMSAAHSLKRVLAASQIRQELLIVFMNRSID